MWNKSIYSGALDQYPYPSDKEVGDFLTFLKQVHCDKKIHLTDVSHWHMPWPQDNFDIYIVCAFGEFINEEFCHRMNQEFADRKLILLTSQYYRPSDLTHFEIFTIEHLHTAVRFFHKADFTTALVNRPHTHGTQSRRRALHKTLITQRLLTKFPDLQYTFCNHASTEYSPDTFVSDLRRILAIQCSDQELQTVSWLHQNPVVVPGHDWDITRAYQDSKLFWTTESVFLTREQCPTAYLTEKTLKPIVAGGVWVVVGQKHSYRRIRAMGFETFETDFAFDFDNLEDRDRLEAVYSMIDQIDFDHVLNSAQIQQKVDFNLNHFFNTFTDCVKQANLPQIERFVNYVNDI